MSSDKINIDPKKFTGQFRKVLVMMGDEARNFFQDSFTNQGFHDLSLSKWKEVKRRMVGTKAYEYPKKKNLGRRTRNILVNTGNLRKGIRRGNATQHSIVVVNSVEYASYNNYGTQKTPQRKFMGISRTLNKTHRNTLKNNLDIRYIAK